MKKTTRINRRRVSHAGKSWVVSGFLTGSTLTLSRVEGDVTDLTALRAACRSLVTR